MEEMKDQPEEVKKLEEARKLVQEEKLAREEACRKEMAAVLEKYGCALEVFSMVRAK